MTDANRCPTCAQLVIQKAAGPRPCEHGRTLKKAGLGWDYPCGHEAAYSLYRCAWGGSSEDGLVGEFCLDHLTHQVRRRPRENFHYELYPIPRG